MFLKRCVVQYEGSAASKLINWTKENASHPSRVTAKLHFRFSAVVSFFQVYEDSKAQLPHRRARHPGPIKPYRRHFGAGRPGTVPASREDWRGGLHFRIPYGRGPLPAGAELRADAVSVGGETVKLFGLRDILVIPFRLSGTSRRLAGTASSGRRELFRRNLYYEQTLCLWEGRLTETGVSMHS